MKLGRAVLVILTAVGAVGCQARDFSFWSRPPIRVGLLHSQTGFLAETEQSMIDAEIMALEEINAAGGLLGGRRVEWTIADGESEGVVFAREARRLIKDQQVRAIFGCYTSFSRKDTRPAVEDADGLLFYPAAYEGLEESPNVVYMGAAPNQQIIPTLKWAYDHLKVQSFFLVGVDSIYSHGLNAIVKDLIRSVSARVVGEEYLGFGGAGLDGVVAAIRKAQPDVVVSSLTGPVNATFHQRMRAAGSSSAECPIISYTLDEELIQKLAPAEVAGDYLTASYLQVIDTPENRAFVERFQARFGRDRVTSDLIETAYNSVRLWARTVQEAETDDPRSVRTLLGRQSLNAPEGIISIDGATQHAWRPSFIGRVRPDRTVEIVWSSQTSIRPEPFPSSRTRADWNRILDQLYKRWGNRWLSPDQPARFPERPRQSSAPAFSALKSTAGGDARPDRRFPPASKTPAKSR